MNRVYLTGNVQPWRTRSMVLYRQRLIEAMMPHLKGLEIATLDPPGRQLPGRVGYQLGRWWNYPRSVHRLSSDGVLHVTDQGYAELAARWQGRSLVTVHDLIPLHMRSGRIPEARIGRLGWALFTRAMKGLRHADRILAVSQATADDLIHLDQNFGQKIVVIPHGVEASFFTESSQERVPHEEIVLGHVGNNWGYKNPQGAVAIACTVARRQTRPVIFLKVGDFLPPALVQELKKCQVQYRPEIATSQAELIACYRQMDLLLFPSWWEGFGWPPLEAMATGTPVVVSDRGALAEYAVPGAAITLHDPAGCSDEECDRIVSLVTDTDVREQAVVRGRDWSKQFLWRDCAQKTLDLYRTLL